MLETEIPRRMHNSVVTRFVDLIILGELKRNGPLSGYDIVSFIHQKFHILISPGKVYSVLYALERNGFVQGELSVRKRKRIYVLTGKGERAFMGVVEASKSFLRFLSSF